MAWYDKDNTYLAQSGTYGRCIVEEDNKEHVGVQFEVRVEKDSDDVTVLPRIVLSDKTARKIGWYFLKEGCINHFRNKSH